MLRLLFLLFLTTLQIAFAQPNTALHIAAAADLEPVLPQLIEQFEQQAQEKVVASYASSATLTAQILNGGPFGLFLAADLSFPEKIVAAGLAQSAHPIPYARGTLVLWTRNGSAFQPITVASLRAPALKTVAVANPEHAPYGRAAQAAIAQLGLTESLKNKLVMAENIAQAAQYAESGNADAGLISLTSALTPRLRSRGTFAELPQNSYPPILQGAVVLKQETATGQRFLDFLLSPPIKKQLAQHGLKAP